jgi:hypothetical protein
MPTEAMGHQVVHQNLPEVVFGVPEIYEKVVREDEDDELSVEHRILKIHDGFEGEDTCQQGWDEYEEETE